MNPEIVFAVLVKEALARRLWETVKGALKGGQKGALLGAGKGAKRGAVAGAVAGGISGGALGGIRGVDVMRGRIKQLDRAIDRNLHDNVYPGRLERLRKQRDAGERYIRRGRTLNAAQGGLRLGALGGILGATAGAGVGAGVGGLRGALREGRKAWKAHGKSVAESVKQ